MHNIVKFIGAALVFLSVAFVVFAILLVRENPGTAGVAAFMSGIGVLVSGAVLYCFGEIVAQLIAIRSLQQQQLDQLRK